MPGHLFLPLGPVLVEYTTKNHTTGFLMMLSIINSYSSGFNIFTLLALA